ncbi:hypothetical protein MY8738_002466 [Beauveria namnaoensis]
MVGTVYKVNCKDWGGNWVRSRIDLGDIVTSSNGVLTCYGGHGW